MEKKDIIVIRGADILRMTDELCTRAGLEDMIRASCHKEDPLIAIKPNLLGPIPASEGATTHPEIAEGVVCYLRRHGFINIIMMESSWVGDKTSDSLLVTGFGSLCERLGVRFEDLQKDEAVDTECAGMMLRVCRKALEADFIINLPVIKGHCQTGMTCALKNMKGCIPASEKRRFHRIGLHEPIGHLSAGIRQGFILADAICPDLTFEDGGDPVQLDTLVCASDPVLMDAYACTVVGAEVQDVPYIRIAQECGVGCGDLSQASIAFLSEEGTDHEGRAVYTEGGHRQQKIRRGRRILKLREIVNEADSCSACYGTLIPVLHRLEEEGYMDRIPHELCIGQGFRGMKGHVGIGSCTSGFDHFLKGCPPSADEMYSYLKRMCEDCNIQSDL